MKLVSADQPYRPPDPRKQKLGSLDTMMQTTLHGHQSDDEKLKLFHKLLVDYLHYFTNSKTVRPEKVHTAPEIPIQQNPVISRQDIAVPSHAIAIPSYPVPRTPPSPIPFADIGPPMYSSTPISGSPPIILPVPTEDQVADAVTAMPHHPEIITHTPSGELVYRGKTIPGTNVVELMAGA